jgi:truncated hemoglobin YjbI
MVPGHPQREAAALAEAFGGPALAGPALAGPALAGPALAGPAPAGLRPERPAFTEEQRARWVALATRAADEAGLPADPEFRSAFTSYLEWSSRASQAGSPPRWDWGPAGPPAEAPAQTSTDDREEVTWPGPDETVSFREHDRKSMARAFDLWSEADVQAHAAAILDRLSDGTMPCDGAWPAEQVEVFRRWTETGFQP